MTKENKSVKNFPNLRFPGFEGDWEEKKLGEIFKISAGGDIKKTNVNDVKTDMFKYPIYANAEKSKGLFGYSDLYRSDENVVTVAGRGVNIGIAHARNHKFYPIVRLLVLKPKNNENIYFFEHQINNLSLYEESTGVPQLTAPQISKYNVFFPSLKEQEKLASFLSIITSRIQTQKKIIEKLESLMKVSRENIFLQKIKFKDYNFPKWEEKKLGDILIESNEKSIKNNQYRVISSTAKGLFYQDDYFTRDIASHDNTGYKILKKEQLVFSPQNLWLGNINVNIDFEIGIVSPSYKIFNFNTSLTSYSYCNFFLKTSLMLFEYAQSSIQGASVVRRNLDLNMFFNIKILLPSINEQTKIANFLSSIQEKIETEKQVLEKLELQKKFLLANLFV